MQGSIPTGRGSAIRLGSARRRHSADRCAARRRGGSAQNRPLPGRSRISPRPDSPGWAILPARREAARSACAGSCLHSRPGLRSTFEPAVGRQCRPIPLTVDAAPGRAGAPARGQLTGRHDHEPCFARLERSLRTSTAELPRPRCAGAGRLPPRAPGGGARGARRAAGGGAGPPARRRPRRSRGRGLGPGRGAGHPPQVERVLERRSVLRRKAAGRSSSAQVLATNVDLVLLVSGLDTPPSPRRLERLADPGLGERRRAGRGAEQGRPLPRPARAACAMPRRRCLPRGCSPPRRSPAPGRRSWRSTGGRTAVLIGPSGVGKSTLANPLLGSERQRTGEVRAWDRRGRHVTSARQLLPLPGRRRPDRPAGAARGRAVGRRRRAGDDLRRRRRPGRGVPLRRLPARRRARLRGRCRSRGRPPRPGAGRQLPRPRAGAGVVPLPPRRGCAGGAGAALARHPSRGSPALPDAGAGARVRRRAAGAAVRAPTCR